MPAAAAASMSELEGMQPIHSTPSCFRIPAIAVIPFIRGLLGEEQRDAFGVLVREYCTPQVACLGTERWAG
jgi:hypothetical protein